MKIKYQRKGFTLVETVIAMAIIAVLITAFIGVFGPSVRGVQKSISRKEVQRLVTTLEREFSSLKPGADQIEYDNVFHKAFEWVEESGSGDIDNAILLYQYRGDINSPRPDGTLNPHTDTRAQIPGQDYVLQSVARRVNEAEVEEELQPGVVEGRVFYIKATQLVKNEDGWEESEDSGIVDPIISSGDSSASISSHEDYPEGSLAFQAKFYVLRSNIFAYVSNTFDLSDSNGDGDPDVTGRPIHTLNMAVLR